MSSVNLVNWFEIPVKDLSKAKSFYETILGIEMVEHEMGPKKMAWFPIEQNGAGATGTLIQGEDCTPSLEGTVVYLHVNDIDETLSKINKAEGKTMVPKTDIGEHGSFAHFEDCEGNRVALHEYPK